MKKGLLIVIEGGDASGKESQTALLKQRIVEGGVDIQSLSFPRYTNNTIGSLLKECLAGQRGNFLEIDSRIVSTLYAADRYETKPLIDKWLSAGSVVVLDRYTSANMLHQGAKLSDEEARKDTIDWIYKVEHEIFGLPVPDLVIYLDVPASVRAGLQKKEGRKEDLAESALAHQEAVDVCSDNMLSAYGNSHRITCMDGESLRSVEDIHEELYNIVKPLLVL